MDWFPPAGDEQQDLSSPFLPGVPLNPAGRPVNSKFLDNRLSYRRVARLMFFR